MEHEAKPTFPTGTFSIATASRRIGCGFTYEDGSGGIAYTDWFVAGRAPTHFVCVDGQNHDDGSWSAKLKVEHPNHPYKGYYLDSSDGWLCAKSSTTERWRFFVKDVLGHEMRQVSTDRPVVLTDERKGTSQYLRCMASSRAVPELVSVTRW